MTIASRFRAASAALWLAAWAALPAAERIDLDRLTPAPEGAPIPVEDFFRPALFRDPQMNPSGTHIAALVTKGAEKYGLLAYDLATHDMQPSPSLHDRGIASFHWLTDRRLIFDLEMEKSYAPGLYAVEVGGMTNAYPLLQMENFRLVSIPPANRERPIIWIPYDSQTEKDLGLIRLNTTIRPASVVDISTNALDATAMAAMHDNSNRHYEEMLSSLQLPREFTTAYFPDPKGTPVLATSGGEGRKHLYYAEDKAWKLSPIDPDWQLVYAAGNEAGQVLALGEATEADKPRPLQTLDVRTGKPVLTLLQDKAYDFNGTLYRDPASHEIVGAFYQRGGPQSVWFTETYRGLQKVFDGYFPGLAVRLVGSDEKLGVFLVETFSDRQPPVYYTIDLAKRLVALVKNPTPWIDPKRMRPTSIIKYKTRDGRAIDAYVTMPAGATKENPPPLVVVAHGFMEARAMWRFDPTVQFLASRGYAVLQPNLRKDDGYRGMFPRADEWDLRKEHEDLTDATRTLVKSGLVDATRVAIMGTRFGGYLAAYALTQEPDLFRCAVSVSGLYDWADWLRDRKFYQLQSSYYAEMVAKLGDPDQDKDKFARLSAVNAAEHARGAMFLAHSRDDGLISINQAQKLASALRDHRVTVDTFFTSEEHLAMAQFENTLELNRRIEAFLEHNLRKGAP